MIFILLHNGKLKKWKNKQKDHNCRRKKHGQPGRSVGICRKWATNKWRRVEWKHVPWEEYGDLIYD